MRHCNEDGVTHSLKRETTGLNLSQWSRPDTQISISVRMSVVNKSNNNACETLSIFLWHCRVLVRRCVLRGDAKNSRSVVMFSKMWVVFMKYVTKYVCFLMIDVCINSSEIHLVRFLGGILCMSAYGCIFVCIVVWDCIQNGVIWGGLLGDIFCYRIVQVIHVHPVISVRTK